MPIDPDMTVSYYEANAEAFVARTVGTDMGPFHARFLRYVPAGGTILDAGCGSGRDTRRFLEMGYRVTAMEPTEALARLAEAHSGQPVLRLRFQEMAFCEAFDGIWAAASLLHVPQREVGNVFRRLIRSLRISGACFMSFKRGSGERFDAGGRLYHDQTLASLGELLRGYPQLETLETWESDSPRPDRQGEFWVQAIVRRSR